MATIAFMGTGLMGSGFVEALVERGHDVRVWNRTADKARALEARGARAFDDPAEAARGAARVHLALSDDGAVDAVLARVAPALDEGATVIDHTTVSPSGTTERAARMAAEGKRFLHAPVFMGPPQARAASGIMLCAGPEAVFRPLEAELARMTGELVYLGERPDKAAGFKLFGNAMIVAIVAGLVDVFTLGRSLGIEPAEAHSLFARFKVGGQLDVRGARMAKGEFLPAGFELSMARKDVRLMLETAGAAGRELAVLPAIARLLDAALADGHGAEDLGAVATFADRPPTRGT
jgi:3-hydroxyisobutyrate dehydrogenase